MAQETICYGSVRAAIKAGYIQGNDTLQALINMNSSVNSSIKEYYDTGNPLMLQDLMYIAYRDALTQSFVSHYVNGRHFLAAVDDPGYGAIYILLGFNIDALLDESDLTSEQSPTIINHLMHSIRKLYNDLEFQTKMNIICNIPGGQSLDNSHNNLIVRCRAQNYLGLLSLLNNSTILELYISNDDIDNINDNTIGEHIHLILRRIHFLTRDAPNYWTNVVRSKYLELFRSLYQEGKLVTAGSNIDIHHLQKIFPEIFSSNFDELSPLCHRIIMLPPIVQLYVLGYPIHLGHPGNLHNGVFISALQRLTEIGKEQYAIEITKCNSSETIEIPVIKMADVQTRNQEDVLDESVFSYNSFDRIVFYSGINRYYFVRPEFESLIKSKKNIWTQEDLPDPILMVLRHRIKLASKYRLPPPGTIVDLLTRIEENRLYQSNFPSSSNESDVMLDDFIPYIVSFFRPH